MGFYGSQWNEACFIWSLLAVQKVKGVLPWRVLCEAEPRSEETNKEHFGTNIESACDLPTRSMDDVNGKSVLVCSWVSLRSCLLWTPAPRSADRKGKEKSRQTVCKPGSVHAPLRRGDGHSSGTRVAASLARPTRAADRKVSRRHAHSRASGRPPLFGLAPGGVYRAVPVAGSAVRSYRTLSPLPRDRPKAARRFAFCGTVPGVAPAGRYPAPFFRGARTFLHRKTATAAIRPSGPRHSWAAH